MMSVIFSVISIMIFSYYLEFWLILYFMFILVFLFQLKLLMLPFLSLISYGMGLDWISYSLILLTIWISSLMILASFRLYLYKFYYRLFMFMLLLLMFSLVLTFCFLNLFGFYLFFEISLIPTLILILGWGNQPERLEAGFYLLFYTLFMSLPMMIMLFYIDNQMGSLFILLKDYMNFNLFMFLCVNMVFFVKIPMFFIHLWLPKAHVEAPISGSMILAGVMLKLGGYGLLRLSVIFKSCLLSYNLSFIIISLFGGAVVSFICLFQSDMKSLIAYSSVSHMSLVLSGLLTQNLFGFMGGLSMMIAHGLSSSGLFCLVNLMYERSHSRSIYMNKGLINIIPSLSLFWFLLLSSNMAAPPSLNLFSEIVLINSLISFYWFNMIWLSILSFFSAAYSLFLYAYSQHGKYLINWFSFYNNFSLDYLLLILHWLPLNLFFLKLEVFIWI